MRLSLILLLCLEIIAPKQVSASPVLKALQTEAMDQGLGGIKRVIEQMNLSNHFDVETMSVTFNPKTETIDITAQSLVCAGTCRSPFLKELFCPRTFEALQINGDVFAPRGSVFSNAFIRAIPTLDGRENLPMLRHIVDQALRLSVSYPYYAEDDKNRYIGTLACVGMIMSDSLSTHVSVYIPTDD